MRIFKIIALLFAPIGAIGVNAADGPKNATIVIIRHAEKPAVGRDLSAAGQQRAQAYAGFFQNFSVNSTPAEPQMIFVAKDSKLSDRPRLTVEPFAKAAGLPIDSRFSNNQVTQLAAEVRATGDGKRILICWHHGSIPNLLRALGVEPKTVLPHGKWPDAVFDWAIVLRFDRDGAVIPGSAKRVEERLMPDDS
ncbi:MAG TPA: hypothetical protein VJS37_11305, partial [Terriglobales bacterium]|nr:hypothetical protein [Terriglobales bacterium]